MNPPAVRGGGVPRGGYVRMYSIFLYYVAGASCLILLLETLGDMHPKNKTFEYIEYRSPFGLFYLHGSTFFPTKINPPHYCLRMPRVGVFDPLRLPAPLPRLRAWPAWGAGINRT
jgi:hypothetical protein